LHISHAPGHEEHALVLKLDPSHLLGLTDVMVAKRKGNVVLVV
jgi:hypothetical protein